MLATKSPTRKTRKPTAAEIKRSKAQWKARDEQIVKRNQEADQATARALIEIVGRNRHIESEIVANFCGREKKYLVDRDEYDNQIHFTRKARHV